MLKTPASRLVSCGAANPLRRPTSCGKSLHLCWAYPPFPFGGNNAKIVEIGATLGLILGSLMGGALAITARREMQRAKTAQRLTAGQFTDVVKEYFTKLDLTPAETEVAWYILKGMSISEIAELRQTREGTVKTQGTAIYKKAGVNGKSQLMSLLVEDLLL